MSYPRRRFPASTYVGIIAGQKGACGCGCGEWLGTNARLIEFDHEMPLWLGGADTVENLRAVIKGHHATKTSREAKDRAKIERIREKHAPGRRLSAKDKALAKMLERRMG